MVGSLRSQPFSELPGVLIHLLPVPLYIARSSPQSCCSGTWTGFCLIIPSLILSADGSRLSALRLSLRHIGSVQEHSLFGKKSDNLVILTVLCVCP